MIGWERYRNIVVGNLYIGGASFDLHLTHLKDTNASAVPYVYKKFTTDGYSTANRNALDIVREDDWDFITVQQVSQDCEKSNTLPINQLQETESIIRRSATNEGVQIFWHATWAYQADSQHTGFGYYDRDQLTMYDGIVDVLKNTVPASGCFNGVIPNTTSIQNARTVFGDILTRDGYHLAVKGKFIAGLMFYKALSLEDISGIIDVPMADIVGAGIAHEFDQPFLQAAIECVNSAFDYPFEITAITQE